MDPYTKLFNNVDADASGTIDLQEFITMLKIAHQDIYTEEKSFLQYQQNEETLATRLQLEALNSDNKDNHTEFLSEEEKQSVKKTLSKLSAIENATRPSPQAVKRSQFKSSHRQYVERGKKDPTTRKEKKEVHDLNTWSTYNPSVDEDTYDLSSQSPAGQTTPRGEHKLKQFYTYQTRDGCLIMHERKVTEHHPTPPTMTTISTSQDENTNPLDIMSTDMNININATARSCTNNQQEQNNKVHWQEITSVNLSDTKLRDPNKFTELSGDCSHRKKVLCWKETVDSSDDNSSDDDDDDDEKGVEETMTATRIEKNGEEIEEEEEKFVFHNC